MKKVGTLTTIVTIILMFVFIGIGIYFNDSHPLYDESESFEVEGTDLAIEYYANKYFNDPSLSWYKGDLNTDTFTLKLVPMEMDEYYYNGVTHNKGKEVFINKIIYVNEQLYDTESLIKANKLDILGIIVVHELIHVYMYQYYPSEIKENQNHGELFKKIESDLIDKGYKGFNYY